MNKFAGRGRDIVIGLVILVVLAVGFFWYKNRKPALKVPQTSNQPSIQTVEQKIKNRFNLTVPDNVEKTALKDVSGGDGSGIATQTEMLVDLPDPEPGTFYQAWLENNLPVQTGGKLVSLGMLRMEKGGWLIDYNGAGYPGFNKVVVSQEKVFDSKIEERVLEGSF
jgi:hypothetical protein